jgi:hypothetical protein
MIALGALGWVLSKAIGSSPEIPLSKTLNFLTAIAGVLILSMLAIVASIPIGAAVSGPQGILVAS